MFLEKIPKHHFLKVGGLCKSIVVQRGGKHCMVIGWVTLIHKKGMKELKEDYRSVSILPTLSKMFGRIMFVQISASFDNVFTKYQCGFPKGYSTQHCNLKMLEKWKNVSVKEMISVLY